MSILLKALSALPDYQKLLASLAARQTVAVSGVSQICRSHVIASLLADTERPALIVCQDDLAAQRVQAELAAMLDTPPELLPGRMLTFYDAAGVSREWEHKRLRLL